MIGTIGRDELRAEMSAGLVTVIDALGGWYYEQQHLPGSLPLAPPEVAEKATSLLPDKGAAIVTYCSNEACSNSHTVAAELIELGYTNVWTYPAGIQDWVAAGLPVESGAPVA